MNLLSVLRASGSVFHFILFCACALGSVFHLDLISHHALLAQGSMVHLAFYLIFHLRFRVGLSPARALSALSHVFTRALGSAFHFILILL